MALPSSDTLATHGMSRRRFVAGAASAMAALGLGNALALADDKASSAKDAAPAGASSDASGKITVVDQLGKTIEFDKVPERVAVTIMPFPAIFFTVMGDTDKIVGCNPASITAYNDSTLATLYPSLANAATEWCGTDFSVNIEELLKLKPDVVFQWTSQPKEIEKMEAAGIKVIALQYGTIDGFRTWINLLGGLFGKQDRAKFLLDYFDTQVAQVTDKIATLSKDDYPTIIQLSDDMKVSGKGFMSFWVDNSGAVNPAADLSGDALQIDMEQVYEWNPDIIYIGNFTKLQPSDLLEGKLEGENWSPVQAVIDGQVYKIPIGGYRWDPPSMETPLVVKWMAKIQHPDLFADMDMEEELRTFYHDVYDFELTDEMVEEVLGDTQN